MTKKFLSNEKNRKQNQNEKGVTLIILVITIVIIFILAGATINMTLGEDGVLVKSQETQNMQKNHVNTEDTEVSGLLGNISEELKQDWQDGSGANSPKLSPEMIPVKWDGTSWVVTNKKDSEWFNYTEKKWANVMLRDGLEVEGITDATIASVEIMKGKKVTKVGSMFVWIPRYGYQITDGYHQSGADINSENPELGAGTINIEFLKGTTDIGVNGRTTWDNRSGQGNWNVHPAFDYNGAVEGIWVAKFEASSIEGNSHTVEGDDVTTKTIQVKPSVASWRYISVNNIYTNCLNYDSNTIGNDSLNSHMMKNSEWGAVAYLAQSTYGKAEEIWINNSSSYITGSAGENVSAEADVGTINDYTSTQGIEASTTGNIYGIYDMSGCSYEYVAAYVDNENENLATYALSLLSGADYTKDKYIIGTSDTGKENYISNSYMYGDAIYETSAGTYNASNDSDAQSWYVDTSYTPNLTKPFFLRGGLYNSASYAGEFAFDHETGSSIETGGFRPVLILK